MLRRGSFLLLCAAIISLSLTGMAPNAVRAGALALPDALSDAEFWNMVTELSEPDGEFQSDNLLSNELFFQTVIPELLRTSKTERVYLGVGPEQNFTYISALKPRMAFIIDIRRGNLQLHLMYKALFELSSDRVGFHLQVVLEKASGRTECQGDRRRDLHRRPQGESEVDRVEAEAFYKQNLKLVQDHLTDTRHLPLTPDDLKGIDYVYGTFSLYGPGLSYWSSGRGGGSAAPPPTGT